MDFSPILTFLIIATLFLNGCVSTPAQQGTVTISSNITAYSPAMSSTVGFDLTPHYSAPVSEFLQYHWIAEYGTFVTWNAPDFRVIDLGNDAITTNGTVYWTYMPKTLGEEPAKVVIVLSVEDSRTGEVLAKAEKTLVRNASGYSIG
jgi:hypothetical protein